MPPDIPGLQHTHGVSVATVITNNILTAEAIMKAQQLECQPLLQKVQTGKTALYKIKNSLLYMRTPKGLRIFLPNSLRKKAVAQFHHSPTSGHAGASKTYQRLIRNFSWRGMLQQT